MFKHSQALNRSGKLFTGILEKSWMFYQ